MLDREEIDVEIARLEYEESSYPNYHKLATLYTIRDQMDGPKEREHIQAPVLSRRMTVDVDGDSDFLRAVSGKDSARAWAVMDDLMDTMQAVNGRVYRNIMERIRAL